MMLVLGSSLLGEYNRILKEKHSSSVFGQLHKGQVTLAKDFALLLDTLKVQAYVSE